MPKKTKKAPKKKVPKKSKPKATETEVAEYKPEKPLVLTDTSFSMKQLLHILQRTPQNHIYSRPAKGGGEWTYVTGTYVKKVLNYTFGWMWDFEIKDKGREGGLVWVQGRLTIKNKGGQEMIVKEQFGRADIKFKRGTTDPLDYGNDLKAASTDALKKCAAELGIASDIYGKNEFREVAETGGNFQTQSAHPIVTAPAKPTTPTTDYIGQLKAKLHKLGAMNEAAAKKIYFTKTGEMIKGFKNLTQDQARQALTNLLRTK